MAGPPTRARAWQQAARVLIRQHVRLAIGLPLAAELWAWSWCAADMRGAKAVLTRARWAGRAKPSQKICAI